MNRRIWGHWKMYMAKDPDVVVYTIGGRKYVGWNELAQAMQEEFDAADRLDVTITDIHVWQHGDVAWFAMELNYNRLEGNEEGQKPMVLPLRDTGVLERRHGRWLLLSWHESLQAPALQAETAPSSTQLLVANGIDLNGDWEVQEEDKTYRAHLDLKGNSTYSWAGGESVPPDSPASAGWEPGSSRGTTARVSLRLSYRRVVLTPPVGGGIPGLAREPRFRRVSEAVITGSASPRLWCKDRLPSDIVRSRIAFPFS